MRIGEIDLILVAGYRIAAIYGGDVLLPHSLVECEAGTLTAAEYVAIEAIRSGQGMSETVRAFCAGLVLGPIESAETIPIH